MAVPARRGRPATRTAKAAPAPAAKPRRAAPAPAPVARRKDVTEYATKPATPYHKAFAKWIVEEVGYDPAEAPSLRAAFLRGVSIATAARPSFNESEFIEEWRATTGEAKRGPKPAAEKAAPAARRRKAAPAPEPEEDDDFEDEDEIDEDDDEFDDEDSDDVDEDDDTDDDDEFDDEDDEPEEVPAPVKRGPGRPRKAAPAPPARKAAPAKKVAPARRAAKPAEADDDDFLF